MDELLELILTPLETELAGQVRQRLEKCRNDPDAEEDEFYLLREALQDFPGSFPPEWWLDPAHCRWWLSLHVDWKAYDEVAWPVQAICRTLGLETGFVSEAEAQWSSFGELDRLRSDHSGSAAGHRVAASMLDRLKASLSNVGLGNMGKTGRHVAPVVPPKPTPPSETPTLDVLEDGSAWLRRQGYELLHIGTGGDEYLAVPVRLDLLAEARTAAEQLKISTFLI